jgi:hypothetical protein
MIICDGTQGPYFGDIGTATICGDRTIMVGGYLGHTEIVIITGSMWHDVDIVDDGQVIKQNTPEYCKIGKRRKKGKISKW